MPRSSRKPIGTLSHYLERQIICRIILCGLCLRLLRLLRLAGNRLLLLPRSRLSSSRSSRTRIGSFRRQHFHIIHINFGDIAHSTRLVAIRTCSYLSFQIQFVTFVHILIHNLRQTVGCNDIMPLCSFGNLGSISQRISTIRCSQRKVATAEPVSKYFTRGSCPTFPINITLFTDISVSSL